MVYLEIKTHFRKIIQNLWSDTTKKYLRSGIISWLGVYKTLDLFIFPKAKSWVWPWPEIKTRTKRCLVTWPCGSMGWVQIGTQITYLVSFICDDTFFTCNLFHTLYPSYCGFTFDCIYCFYWCDMLCQSLLSL